MNIKRSRILPSLGLALLAGMFAVPQEAVSQSMSEVSSANGNWDVFRSAGDNMEKGDKLFGAGKYEEALDLYRKALEMFQKLHASDPDWNGIVVNYRITSAQSKISSAEQKVRETIVSGLGSTSTSVGSAPSDATAGQQANDELMSLRSQVDALKKQAAENQNAVERATRFGEQAAALTKEKSELQRQLNDLTAERDALKAAGGGADAGKMAAELAAAQKTAADRKAALDSLQASYNETKKSESELKLKAESAARTAAELAGMKSTASQLERRLAEEQKKSAAIEEERKKLESDLAQARSANPDNVKKLENDLAALKKQKDADAAKTAELAKKNASLSEEYTRLNAKYSALNSENSALKNALVEARKSTPGAAAAPSVEPATAGADAKALADANAKIKSLTDENAKLKADLAAAKKTDLPVAVPVRSEADIKALAEADANAKNLAAANEKVKSLTDANAKLNADLNTQKAATQKALEDAAKSAGTLSEANAKMKVLMDANAKLASELNEQKTIAERSVAELDAAKRAAAEASNRPVPAGASSRILALTQEKAKLQDELVAAKAELDAVKAKSERSGVAAASATALVAAEQRASALESDVARLNSEVKDLTEQNKKLAAGEAVRKSLEAENKTLTDSKAASDKEIAALKAQVASFSEPSSSDSPDLAKQKELNASLTASVEKLTAEKNASVEELAKANRDLVSAQAQLEKLKIDQASNMEVRRLAESLEDKEALLKKSNAEKDAFEKESAAYRERCEALQNTLSNLLTTQTALNAKVQRLEREVELRRRDPKSAGSAELQQKNESIAELLKERAAFDEEVAALKSELEDERALSSRYKKTMNAARTVAEAAIVESRTLRAELNTYRRNDPDAKPEVARTEDSIPEDLKPMFEDIMSGKEVTPTVVVDTLRFENAMKDAQRAENAKDFSTALWHYLIAADADPSNPLAQLSLARVHYALKHADNAMKAYEKALKLGAKRDLNLENMLNAVQGASEKK